MFSLRKRGKAPYERALRSFVPGDALSIETLALQHNESVRAIRSLQDQIANLINQDRELVGRVDVIEGKPDSVRGNLRAVNR